MKMRRSTEGVKGVFNDPSGVCGGLCITTGKNTIILRHYNVQQVVMRVGSVSKGVTVREREREREGVVQFQCRVLKGI